MVSLAGRITQLAKVYSADGHPQVVFAIEQRICKEVTWLAQRFDRGVHCIVRPSELTKEFAVMVRVLLVCGSVRV